MRAMIKMMISEFSFMENQTLVEAVYEGFYSLILNGKIPYGYTINLTHFSEALNVSRTPVRKALILLEKKHYVQKIQGEGYQVIHQTDQISSNVLKMFQLKKQLINMYLDDLNDAKLECCGSLLIEAVEEMRKASERRDLRQFLGSHDQFMKIITGMMEDEKNDEVIQLLTLHTKVIEEGTFIDLDQQKRVLDHAQRILKNPDIECIHGAIQDYFEAQELWIMSKFSNTELCLSSYNGDIRRYGIKDQNYLVV